MIFSRAHLTDSEFTCMVVHNRPLLATILNTLDSELYEFTTESVDEYLTWFNFFARYASGETQLAWAKTMMGDFSEHESRTRKPRFNHTGMVAWAVTSMYGDSAAIQDFLEDVMK